MNIKEKRRIFNPSQITSCNLTVERFTFIQSLELNKNCGASKEVEM